MSETVEDYPKIHSDQLLDYHAKRMAWRTRIRDGQLMAYIDHPDDELIGFLAEEISDLGSLEDARFGDIASRVLTGLSSFIRHSERSRYSLIKPPITTGEE